MDRSINRIDKHYVPEMVIHVLMILIGIIICLLVRILMNQGVTFEEIISSVGRTLFQVGREVLRTVTNPKVIGAYLFVYIAVAFFAQIPDALRTALMKQQNLKP